MRILLIGFDGTIGSAVAEVLAPSHELVRVSHAPDADYTLDLIDPDDIRRMYGAVGPVDAVVCAAGLARFGALETLTDEDYDFSLRNKLMGQINLVRIGVGMEGAEPAMDPPPVPPGGSFTLISGNLSIEPEANGALAGLVSGGLEAWVRGAALELEGRYRVNIVSPRAIREALVRWGMDPEPGIPAAEVAKRYRELVEGEETGVVAFF